MNHFKYLISNLTEFKGMNSHLFKSNFYHIVVSLKQAVSDNLRNVVFKIHLLSDCIYTLKYLVNVVTTVLILI